MNWTSLLNKYLIEEDGVSEIASNGPGNYFIKRRGVREEIPVPHETEEEYVRDVKEGLIEKFDLHSPKGNQFVAEGRGIIGDNVRARIHITMPPACDYPNVTIARKSTELATLESLRRTNMFTKQMLDFMEGAIDVGLTTIISGGTGSGKALHKDTLIPTSKGMKTMGEIEVGDILFDEKGNKTSVELKYCPNDPEMYEVAFNNGETVKTSAGHLWQVEALEEDSWKTKVMTTKEIVESRILNDKGNFKYYIQGLDVRHYIIVIEEIDDNPNDYFCIQVDSPNKLFMCTESNIPTHNTTLMEAMTKRIPADTRIGVAEDAQELVLAQKNVVYLHSTVWSPGMDENEVATLSWCVQQLNRQRVDRILVGETRGKEFYDFIVAANSGCEGSMTTIHANDAKSATRKMANFITQQGHIQTKQANQNISETIHLIIQIGIVNGKHKIIEIAEVTQQPSGRDNEGIVTHPIFTYDEVSETWTRNQVTDALRKIMVDKGFDPVALSPIRKEEDERSHVENRPSGLPSPLRRFQGGQ